MFTTLHTHIVRNLAIINRWFVPIFNNKNYLLQTNANKSQEEQKAKVITL